MIVSELYIYPIKSCKGIKIQSIEVNDFGFKYDRQWVVVDRNNCFITQRQFPKMALIETEIKNSSLTVKIPSNSKLSINLETNENKELNIKVWNDWCKGFGEKEEINNALSDFLGIDSKLVRLSKNNKRITKSGESKIAFQDGYPFLIISEASLQDLNKLLKKPLPMNRFRPNIVLSDCNAYDEDNLENIKINDVNLIGIKECERCTITTVNQLTGQTEGKEPLATLATFRRTDKGVKFGKNFSHLSTGRISTGNLVEKI